MCSDGARVLESISSIVSCYLKERSGKRGHLTSGVDGNTVLCATTFTIFLHSDLQPPTQVFFQIWNFRNFF